MKQLLLVAAIVFSVAAHAQSDKYADAMKQNLINVRQLQKLQLIYENAAASFQRIGDAEKTQWLPYYWEALALATEGWKYYPDAKGVTEVKVQDLIRHNDCIAARINAVLDKADAIATDDAAKSEILTIRNMAATQQMLVDPQSRYMTFGAQAGTGFAKSNDIKSKQSASILFTRHEYFWNT